MCIQNTIYTFVHFNKMRMKKILIIIAAVVVAAGAGMVYARYFFVFGRGVKTGTLNQIVEKGYIFKTYEGRLILSGMHSSGAGMLQSNTFDFSASPAAASQLMQADNHALRLYYSEYKHALPWRGNSRYVVDSVFVIY
jgi:hypothetical protein